MELRLGLGLELRLGLGLGLELGVGVEAGAPSKGGEHGRGGCVPSHSGVYIEAVVGDGHGPDNSLMWLDHVDPFGSDFD